MDSGADNIYKRAAFRRPALPVSFVQDPSGPGLDGMAAEPGLPMDDVEQGQATSSRYDDSWNPAGPSNMGAHSSGVSSMHRKAKQRERANYVGADRFETHAYEIVARIEENPDLLEDTPIGEQLRKETLRDLPQCLTMKRSVKSKLSKSISQKSKRRPIGAWKRFKYQTSFAFSKFKADSLNVVYKFEPWYGRLKQIEGHFGSGYASYFKFLRWLFLMNLLVAVLSFVFLTVPQISHDLWFGTTNNDSFYFGDIFLGNGYFTDTILYYGHYSSKLSQSLGDINYNMPTAYFTLVVLFYLVPFLILSVSVARSYSRSYIETEGGLRGVFANKVFCGWDYGIATQKAAVLKSESIYHEITELLNELSRDSIKVPLLKRLWTAFVHVLVNLLVIAGIVGISIGMYELLRELGTNQDDSVIVVSIVINIVMLILPAVLSYIASLEGYKTPRVALYVTMLRTFLLGFAVLATVAAFWLSRAAFETCWETQLAQEIYRLVMFDFVISVLATTLFEICWFMYFRKEWEFDISRHTLQLIYNQGLFWLGFHFAPLLSLLVTLKMFLLWYVRDYGLQYLCRPPAKSWRGVQNTTLFSVMVYVTILLATALHAYVITTLRTSQVCGPFVGYNRTFDIVTGGITTLQEQSFVGTILLYITKPGVVALIMVGCCALVYYMREKSVVERKKVGMLREMMVWMAKDKQYLLDHINAVTDGRFYYDTLKRRINSPVVDFTFFPNTQGASKIETEADVHRKSSRDDVSSRVS